LQFKLEIFAATQLWLLICLTHMQQIPLLLYIQDLKVKVTTAVIYTCQANYK